MLIRNRLKIILTIVFLIAISGCSFDFQSPTETSGSTGTSQNIDANFPNTPTPADGAINQLLFVTLRWECNNASEYDVYLGETNPPLIKYTTTSIRSYTTPPLKYGTRYYWRIVAKGNDGITRTGPVWSFTTIPSTLSTINGYALKLYKTETKLPNTVEVIFQVVDLNGSGITNLQLSDFEVFEDELPLSISESGLTVEKRPVDINKFKTVLMLDNSTSLENDINTIRNSAKQIVDGIRPNQLVALYQFSDKPILLKDFTGDINLLKNIIDNNYALGVRSTDFYGAMKFGAKRWEDVANMDSVVQGCLVVISDGEDTQGSTSLADGLNSVHNKLVYSIALGPALQPEIMNAFSTGGSFKPGQEIEIIKRFIELENSMNKIANSFYLLKYSSPKRGNKDHSLKIRIKNNPYQGDESFISTKFNSAGFN